MKIQLNTQFWDMHTPQKTEKLLFKYTMGITLMTALTIMNTPKWITYTIAGWIILSMTLMEITYNQWRKKQDD